MQARNDVSAHHQLFLPKFCLQRDCQVRDQALPTGAWPWKAGLSLRPLTQPGGMRPRPGSLRLPSAPWGSLASGC